MESEDLILSKKGAEFVEVSTLEDRKYNDEKAKLEKELALNQEQLVAFAEEARKKGQEFRDEALKAGTVSNEEVNILADMAVKFMQTGDNRMTLDEMIEFRDRLMKVKTPLADNGVIMLNKGIAERIKSGERVRKVAKSILNIPDEEGQLEGYSFVEVAAYTGIFFGSAVVLYLLVREHEKHKK